MTHASIPAETRRALGLADALVRLSPGCESGRDLVADVLQALETLTAVKTGETAATAQSALA
jgi:cystathionine beta-lyase/cystathionine gamma-synthase